MSRVKNKILLGILMFITLTVAFLYVGKNYLVKNVEVLSVEIIHDREELNNYENRNKQLVASRGNYREIKNEIEDISEVVVDKDKTVEFIEEIEKVANSNGVKLELQSSFGSGDESKKGDGYISQKSFGLKAAGDFNGMMRFLYSLENFNYYMNVENIQIGLGDFDEYNKGLVILNADITVYQKQNEEN
jgi:hypothetical protein